MKTLDSKSFAAAMFIRPMPDGRCLLIAVLDKAPLPFDSVVVGTVVLDEYREAPEACGKTISTVLSEGWKGVPNP